MDNLPIEKKNEDVERGDGAKEGEDLDSSYEAAGKMILEGQNQLNDFKVAASIFSLIILSRVVPGFIGEYRWMLSLAVLPVVIYFVIKKNFRVAVYIGLAVIAANIILKLLG